MIWYTICTKSEHIRDLQNEGWCQEFVLEAPAFREIVLADLFCGRRPWKILLHYNKLVGLATKTRSNVEKPALNSVLYPPSPFSFTAMWRKINHSLTHYHIKVELIIFVRKRLVFKTLSVKQWSVNCVIFIELFCPLLEESQCWKQTKTDWEPVTIITFSSGGCNSALLDRKEARKIEGGCDITWTSSGSCFWIINFHSIGHHKSHMLMVKPAAVEVVTYWKQCYQCQTYEIQLHTDIMM